MEHISIHALREEGDGAPHPAGARTQHFYPRPPRGGRRSRNSSFGKSKVFLSTPSARRATTRGLRRSCRGPISIHALREEGDPRRKSRSNLWSIFLSTPSVRRATPSRHFLLRADAYFYPRPPRGGRQPGLAGRKDISYFYPRPPRGGRRLGQTGRATQFPISIYALREEGDKGSIKSKITESVFLSTPSARRATYIGALIDGRYADFYPRPPRGGRRGFLRSCAGSWRFLSTPSARRATPETEVRTGQHGDFYPRPPRGGRLKFADCAEA